MGRVVRTATAEADLFDIWLYIADDNLDAADKLLADIDRAFALLAKSPNIGFAAGDVKPGVRCKPVRRNYLILYEVKESDVVILRVVHSARRHEDLL